jgi:hypothetical protein
LHETPLGILSDIAKRVVQIEGPIHLDELVARIRTLWGLQRAGGRIQSAVEQAVAHGVRTGELRKAGMFLSIPGQVFAVRDRNEASSPSLRRPEMLPDAEIAQAALAIVANNFGAQPDEIVQAVSRALGFKSTSAQIKAVIDDVIDDLVEKQALVAHGSVLIIGPTSL